MILWYTCLMFITIGQCLLGSVRESWELRGTGNGRIKLFDYQEFKQDRRKQNVTCHLLIPMPIVFEKIKYFREVYKYKYFHFINVKYKCLNIRI